MAEEPKKTADSTYPDMPNFEAFYRLAKPINPEATSKNLMFFAEEHTHPENDLTYATAIRANKAAFPEQKMAVFIELPPVAHVPDRGKLNIQAAVDQYLKIGVMPESEGITLGPRFMPVLIEARKQGTAVFMIDDQPSIENLQRLELMAKTSRQLSEGLPFGDSRHKAYSQEADLNATTAQKELKNTLPRRNETMAARIETILKGSNGEEVYQEQMKNGPFDRAMVINGALHLSDKHDMNESTLAKLGNHPKFNKAHATTIELFSDPAAPSVLFAPHEHKLDLLNKLHQPDKTQISINIKEHGYFDEYDSAAYKALGSLSVSAVNVQKTTPNQDADKAVDKVERTLEAFTANSDHKKALDAAKADIDSIQGLPIGAKSELGKIKAAMDGLVDHEKAYMDMEHVLADRLIHSNVKPSDKTNAK